MGIPSKTLTRKRGFTIIEMLIVLTISSLMLVVLGSLFATGFWEISHSSGRIELVRRGRRAIDNCQAFLASASKPNPDREAVSFPATFDDDLTSNPQPRVQFYTPYDHLVADSKPLARELTNNPVYHSYELAAVPGDPGRGQSLQLSKYQPPAGPGLDPLFPDTTVRPRIIVRDLGVPKTGVPGGYGDGFIVRYRSLGTVQIEVNLSSALINDSYQKNTIQARTPMLIKMRSIIQIPYYNVR